METVMDKATSAQKREEPWQLRMLRVSLKKSQKLKSLLRHLSSPVSGRCLLITCGDNNGALNVRLREAGGDWSFCDLEPDNVAEMAALLGQDVLYAADPADLLYADASFDTVVTIDCQEHLDDPLPFTREVARVLKPGGRAILTVPNGNERKLAVRVKNLLGMTKEFYGHKVVGYDVPELEAQSTAAGLQPGKSSSYSRLFTELVELAINFMYVKILARKKRRQGQIAPTSKDQLQKMEKVYRVYRVLYPFLWAVSLLDFLVPFGRGYAVVLETRKPAR